MAKHYTKNMGEITYVYGVNLEEHKKVIEKQQKRIAELEQELAEFKEKAIVPRFKKGDTAYAIIDTAFYTDVFKVNVLDTELCYRVDRGDNDISTQHYTRLFATEQEAQEKLKEIQGNE